MSNTNSNDNSNGLVDPRAGWNAVELLAKSDPRLAHGLAHLLRALEAPMASLAAEIGVEGGTRCAEECAEQALTWG